MKRDAICLNNPCRLSLLPVILSAFARDFGTPKTRQSYFELVLRRHDQAKSLYRIWAETNQRIFFVENEEVAAADHFIASVPIRTRGFGKGCGSPESYLVGPENRSALTCKGSPTGPCTAGDPVIRGPSSMNTGSDYYFDRTGLRNAVAPLVSTWLKNALDESVR